MDFPIVITLWFFDYQVPTIAPVFIFYSIVSHIHAKLLSVDFWLVFTITQPIYFLGSING